MFGKNKNNDEQYYFDDSAQSWNPEITAQSEQNVALYVAKVMGWMSLGLFTTMASAIAIWTVPALQGLIFSNSYSLFGVVILQLVAAFSFHAVLRKMGSGAATACYLLYSVLTGVTFVTLSMIYTMPSILFAFGLTGSTFLLMALYGYFTKTDLTRLGSLCLFALLGIILCSLFNFFILRSSMFDLIICCVGVVIFIGLIAYDTQKIKNLYYEATATGGDGEQLQKIAIYGAFMLYLDFINLFIRLLQLFGKRRN